MSLRHEQGLTPFPLSQCWNMARQQSLGSPRHFLSMVSISVPLWSKFMRNPRSRQSGASVAMILIFFPSAVFSSDSSVIVGWESEIERISKRCIGQQLNTTMCLHNNIQSCLTQCHAGTMYSPTYRGVVVQKSHCCRSMMVDPDW